MLHDSAQPHSSQATFHKVQVPTYEMLAPPTDYHILIYFVVVIRNEAFLNNEYVIEAFGKLYQCKR